MSGIEDIRPGSGSFEYLLNVPTVIKHSMDAPVFYMNQGEWYEFCVDMKEAPSEKLYFKVQLDFVNEEYRKSRNELISGWFDRHPECRLLELEEIHSPEKESLGTVQYNKEPDNLARYIVDGSKEVKFKVKINCLESQFYKEIPVISMSPMGFYLIVSTYAEESRTLLDTTLCLVRTFWNGRSKFNCESDRFVLLDKNPNVACPNKYSLIQTILNPHANTANSDEVSESVRETDDLPPSSVVAKKPANQLDDRMFVCVLQAPHFSQNGTYIDKDSLYGLVIKPTNFDSSKLSGVFQTKIFLDFGSSVSASKLSAALTNWSIISRQTFAFSVHPYSSELDESVHDLYQNGCNEANLVWSPGKTKEVKLMLMFNVESSKLARFVRVPEIDMSLIVQTSEMTNGQILDQSECKICVFSPGTSSHQFQIDTTSSSESHASENYTIMKNSISFKPQKQIQLNAPESEEVESSEAKLYPIISSVDKGEKKISLKIASVELDGQKLFTLQEQFFLEHFTVAELELKILDLISRKQASQPVKSAAIFFGDTPMTDDIIGSMVCQSLEIDFNLSIITDDPSGDFLAFMNGN